MADMNTDYEDPAQAHFDAQEKRIRELEAALRQVLSIHDELHHPCAEIMAAAEVANNALASQSDREVKR